jgi:hypothetical protein
MRGRLRRAAHPIRSPARQDRLAPLEATVQRDPWSTSRRLLRKSPRLPSKSNTRVLVPWPVPANPLHRVSATVAAPPFKWPVDLGIDAADQNSQLSEHGESGFRFNTPLQQNSGKVLPCFGEGSIRREETDSRGMCFENLSNTLAQDCANQYVRVENHHFRRGPSGGYGVLP